MGSYVPSRRQLLASALVAPLAKGQAGDPLSTLRKQHPRLIALDSDIERTRGLIASNAEIRRLRDQLVSQAERILKEPPVEYKLIGPRLLDKSRTALGRIYTLALLCRLDGKREYFERAVAELRAVCEFVDWHPPHFLDTAEMTHAVAIGYDWLYSALSESERRWMRKAIVEKGLEPGLKIYRSGGWWAKSEFNWNQVCNGGMTAGALAIADEEPEMAREVIRSAVKSLPVAMASYAPDGGWAEGPGYWDYATSYTVYMMAALDSALGTDFGLSKAAGFDQAGRFRVYFSGPADLSFNYADAAARVGPSAAMFWLARRFDNPVYAWQQQSLLRKGRPHALDLVWYREKAASPREAGWPLDACFRGVNVGFLRSSWDTDNAVFAAAKGGDNKANHGHLDLGSFVLDAGGVRWAVDLGGDNYNLPEYFGKKRWTYYRLRTESHNTVLVDGENQSAVAKSAVRPGKNSVEIDLGETYPSKLKSWVRKLTLENEVVRVTGRIRANAPVEPLWGMVTEASVSLDGRRAALGLSGRKLTAEIASPGNAVFDVVSTQPTEPENQNKGTRKLVVRLPERVTEAEIAVTFRLV